MPSETVEALQYGKPKKNDPRKTPAPPKDRKKGSKKNKPGSAKKPNSSIKMSKETESRIRNLMEEHNKKVAKKGKGSKATMGRLKSVFRRGAGAFSRSHAPNMSRTGWGVARVKAFLYLLRNGRPSNPNYKQDNDLLPKSHPRASEETEDYEDWDNEVFSAAEYQGRKVTLNKPFRTPGKSKKFAVYTRNEKGTVVIVRFGDPNMEIKRDDPKRRKAFRDRHNCASPGPKWKARYWSCYQWRSGSKVKGSQDFNKTSGCLESDMGCGCGCKDTSVQAKMEDYLFSSPDGARKKSQEIGFDGEIHESTLADGTKIYSPAKTEREFIEWYRKNDSDAENELSAAEPTPKDNETHDQYMSRCQEMGYSEEECMAAHKGHTFMDEEKVEGYGGGGGGGYSKPDNSCKDGYEKRNGMCVKVAFNLDVDVTVDETVIEASTGRQIVRITGIAFHDGINKNGWQLTRKGAELAISQMFGADLTLNHPPAENGRFTRNMDGGVKDAIVGIVTEAFIVDTEQGWDVGFKAEVHRPELFEALESGMWLRPDYGVSIGGTGIPDSVTEHKDGKIVMTFESDFRLDHLAIVHRPAYPRANIKTVEKLELTAEEEVSIISQTDSGVNTEKVNIMTDEEIINIEASEEDVVETVAEEVITPDYSAEIEALKASLAEKESEVAAFKAAEELKVEEMRLSLVAKATSLGMSGHDELNSETLESLIASWEASKPVVEDEVVEMKPIKASTDVEVVSTPSEDSDMVVANYLNGRKLKTPESTYEKAFNVWASAWNKTQTDSKAPTYAEAKEKMML
ncbi:MAG: hypothetical protein Tp1100DCM51572_14 [Prokaryotic dsDNA virus sp.]|nr:MAG: hypothetical protein Tp1100DCM51572_14 [Prokaryotic dsDNA virus sp.]|tara:strand:+ start:12051 stop:14441 length:2391 start_codon:yes stop_codon:yes gene_type:complete